MTAMEWSLIVREHSPVVWKTAYRLLLHEADAADCLQETFVAAWRLAQRQTVKNWPGLLQHLATARALDSLRKRMRRSRHLTGTNVQGLAARAHGPEARAQQSESAEQLRAALARLPPQQSAAYCLRHLNGMSYEAIAAELETSVSAVGVLLHRATARLRTSLTSLTNDHDPRSQV